jgi:carboxyl-terminal processing protease
MSGSSIQKRKNLYPDKKRIFIFVIQYLENWKMKTLRNIFFLIFFITAVATGCKEGPLPEPEPPVITNKDEAPVLTQKINSFIQAVMTDIYLWYKDVPVIDTRYEKDSKLYFKKLLFKEDKWSFVTEDVVALENSFEGVETSYGYSLAFGRFSNTGNIFALIEYVYPDTPADNAGLKRGDIIVLMDGADITDKNYTDLLYAANVNITRGVLTPEGISVDNKTINMVAKQLTLDPVLIKEVVEHGDQKIGYLFYAQYIGNFNSSLDDAFQYFLDQQVRDVVIDLRYNPGGGTNAAQHLTSSIAPLSAVNTGDILVSFQWNDKYQQYFQSENIQSQLGIPFIKTTPVKMGLNKVYILTGPGTASASELTITGLKPYMEVVTVGDTTYGKYTASITFKPEDFYEDPNQYSDFKNWGIQPIVLRYANKLGVTDFKNGFSPDILVEENLFDGIPLGSKDDPLMKAALEHITGVPVIAMKKARIAEPAHRIFDRGFSRFDQNKRELLIEEIDLGIIKK